LAASDIIDSDVRLEGGTLLRNHRSGVVQHHLVSERANAPARQRANARTKND
jgi:hypothetical protein